MKKEKKFVDNGTNCTLPLTTNAAIKVRNLDHQLIGTEDYMGWAWFWGQEWKYFFRELTPRQRKQIHNELVQAGLDLVKDGKTAEYTAIVKKWIKKLG